jgi:Tol biopolymer transport system component
MNISNFKVGLLILLFVVFIGFCEAGSVTPPSKLKDKIVYVSEKGVCTINPDGTGRKVIVPSEKGGPFSNPQWSPDKQRIGFNCKVKGWNRIMIVDHDGSNLKIISFPKPKMEKSKAEWGGVWLSEQLYFWGWSPSGEYFLGYGTYGDGSQIGVMTIEGELKASFGGFDGCFADENNVIYLMSASRRGGGIIFGFDLITKKKRKIIENFSSLIQYFPVACSNKGEIAFAWPVDSGEYKAGKEEPSKDELWITNISGSETAKLATQGIDFVGGTVKVIAFSPRGDELLFIPRGGDRSDIYVIKVDGTELRKLTDNIVNMFEGVSWSPDGKRIVFVSDKDGNNELYIINVDGTGLRRLTKNNINDCCPDW